MKFEFALQNINDAVAFFLKAIGPKKNIALHGQMGAGKTTFVHAVCKSLGVIDEVSSPTFSIINQYTTATGSTIFHLDLYRIKNEQEALDAGVEDCFYSNNLCFVEWPEIAPNLLLTNVVHCYISIISATERSLVIK